MDEALFARLAHWLTDAPVVLASVRDTRGATPRKRDSRMLIGADAIAFSVGGGAAEARVIETARAMLHADQSAATLQIDLSGRPGADGVCGGTMQLSLRRWHGAADAIRAATIAQTLAHGRSVTLSTAEIGPHDAFDATPSLRAEPDPRLLIVGGGHCALALYDLARFLDFDLWVFDPRESCFRADAFATATRRWGDYAQLAEAFASERAVYIVLLNRDFPSDVATLREIATRPHAFLGMMGSRKRIAEVLAALPSQRDALSSLQAPIGLDIEAETPHEIAVSILAQLIAARSAIRTPATSPQRSELR
jgi:xanthine dehydrogenase accessory factor